MPKPRILVIDDDAGIRESLRMTLEYDGYEVLGAATGQEGLALVERDTPDLVLLDVKMPGMDGLDVLSRLRSSTRSSATKTVRSRRRLKSVIRWSATADRSSR